MYLSVNVYKIIAIIVLIPRDDDAYIIADARKTEIKWAVSLAKREGGEGEMENARVAGTNEILKRDEYPFHKI